MKRIVILVMAVVVMTAVAADAATAHRFGVGANYWRTIEEIDDNTDFESDGLSWYLSYQMMVVPILKLEGDLEWYPNGYGGSTDSTYSPEAFLIVGAGIYGGLGIGINYSDGEWAEDPFYMIRAGWELEIASGLHLDLNLNYRFIDWENVEALDQHVDTDTITLGAAVRMQF